VRVATVEESSGAEQLRLLGRVVAAEPRMFKLIAGLDGYAREVSDVTSGSQVRKDQWLMTISAPEIRQPVQGFIATLDSIDRETRNGTVTSVQIAFAKATGDQAVDRLLTLGMSPIQIEEIRRTHVVPPNIHMTAPAAGFVVARNVSTGEKIEKGSELFRIADLRQVWVLADVAAQDAQLITPGMSAELSLGGRPLPLRARVTTGVLPQFDAETQHFKLRFEVDNTAFALRPEMFVDVDVTVNHGRTIEVPADAVVGAGLKNTVFVERSAGLFEPRGVKVGRRAGGRVEILEGVAPGERIVVSGTFLLDSESRMRAGAPARVDGHD
jgi:Cu(I)/Ag(I) efflux system membrane fusion protein